MPLFRYEAKDLSGRSVSGIIDAETVKAAIQSIKTEALIPIEIKEVKRKAKRSIFKKSLSDKELYILTRQLATLTSSGLPLYDALSAIVEQQQDETLKDIVGDIREKIKEGGSLSDALYKHRDLFGDVYISTVKAGEESGTLDTVLTRLSDLIERRMNLKKRIESALTYPAIMTIVGIFVIGFVITYIIPKVVAIFSEFHTKLPLTTRILIAVSSFLTRFWPTILISVFSLIYIFTWYYKKDEGRRKVDSFILKLPIFGKAILSSSLSRFFLTLQTLLTGGISLVEALRIGKNVLGNKFLEEALDRVIQEVESGSSFALPLKKAKIFPPLVIRMVDVGEKGGTLEEMLSNLSKFYEDELGFFISNLTSLLEPLIILFMGTVVGIIVVSILVPIFEMSQVIR